MSARLAKLLFEENTPEDLFESFCDLLRDELTAGIDGLRVDVENSFIHKTQDTFKLHARYSARNPENAWIDNDQAVFRIELDLRADSLHLYYIVLSEWRNVYIKDSLLMPIPESIYDWMDDLKHSLITGLAQAKRH